MAYQNTLVLSVFLLMISIADLKGAILDKDRDGLGRSQLMKSDTKGAWELVISPVPELETKVLIKRADETLNLTCKIQRTEPAAGGVNGSSMHAPADQQFNLAWYVPISLENSKNRVINNVNRDSLQLIVQNLRDTDTGEYKCTAKEAMDNPDTHLFSGSLNVQVKPKRGLLSKLQGCDKLTGINCSLVNSPCCNQLHSIQLSLDVSQYATTQNQQYNEISYLQTTIYTVIGCAMAFMFVITIIVIAICRVHLKRGAMVRYPPPSFRPATPQDPEAWGNLLLDLTSSGGVLVRRNVREGLHLLGHPHPGNPPPYDEVVQGPPQGGPPPPYSSVDNLNVISADPPVRPRSHAIILTLLNASPDRVEGNGEVQNDGEETRVPLLGDGEVDPASALVDAGRASSREIQ